MKKGFTLIELLAVIVVLGILSLLVVPKALEIISSSKEKAYNSQVDRIFDATNRYASDYENPINWDSNRILVSVQQLIDGSYLEAPIIDQRTGQSIPGTTQVEVLRSNEGKYTFRLYTPTPEVCFGFSGGTITGYDVGNSICPTYLIIPETIGGVPVTSISDWAFEDLGLTGVSFPDSLTSMGAGAFAGNLISSLELPKNVTTLRSFLFSDNMLTSITIPSNIDTIENEVFNYNLITSMTIPTTVHRIDALAFNNNLVADESKAFIYERNSDGSENRKTIVSYAGAKRANVIVPEGVERLRWWSFCGNEIESITLPSTLKVIEEYALASNYLTDITIPSNVTEVLGGAFNKNFLPDAKAFIYARNPDGSVNNTYIASYGGIKKDNVVIPSGVQIIGYSSFYDIGLTTDVTIPSTVTFIGTLAFNRNFLPDSKAFIYARNGDGSINNSWVVSYAGGTRDSVIIPNNVTRIGQQAFQNEYMYNITLPSNLVTIDGYAFQQNHLTNLTIPGTVTSIGEAAFASNDVSHIVMNRATTTIGDMMVSWSDNNFRTSYVAGGIGTYNRSANGTWTKQ